MGRTGPLRGATGHSACPAALGRVLLLPSELSVDSVLLEEVTTMAQWERLAITHHVTP